MKNIKNKFLFACACISLSIFACNNEAIDTYSGENGIYFAMQMDESESNSSITDTLTVSLFALSADVKDTTFNVHVWTIGLPSGSDRTYNVEVDDRSTAILNDEYNAIPTSFTFPANATRASFPITVKRSERMQREFIFLSLKLVESADFSIPFTEDMPPQGVDSVKMNVVTFILSDKLPKPEGWDDRFLGVFSSLKMEEITKVTGIPWSEFDAEDGDLMPQERLNAIKFVMQIHLDEMKAAGTPVMDYQMGDDGNPLLDENGNNIMIEMTLED